MKSHRQFSVKVLAGGIRLERIQNNIQKIIQNNKGINYATQKTHNMCNDSNVMLFLVHMKFKMDISDRWVAPLETQVLSNLQLQIRADCGHLH